MTETERPPRTGRFLGVPYDWRWPTVGRVRSRWWNPDDPRLFTPKAFGWGWDVNLARLVHVGRNAPPPAEGTPPPPEDVDQD